MSDHDRHDTEHKRGEPSTATSETAKPEPIIDDDRANGRRDQPVFGSEGSGGDSSPAEPRERKRRS